ncbi:trypsin-like serine protease [Streptomyces sp. MN03-5084-2B]|nr:trypsin-like serine protease [Streptomyces sp. MN03-5084-2B]
MVFADCATPPEGNIGLLRVRTSNTAAGTGGRICFKILSTPAQLSLKVPAVFEIRGDGQVAGTGHQVQADLTTEAGQHSTVQVNPSGPTPVGVGAKPGDPPTTLLQLTAGTAAGPTVSGGSSAPGGAYPFVGRLNVGHPGAGGRSCSATLIDSFWILTATTCFGDTGLQTGAPPQPTTVTLGRTATNAGRTAHVSSVTPKPGTNVTLGLLDAPVTDITPPALSTTAPAPNETLTAVGYGRTADTWVPDQARATNVTVNTTTDTTATTTSTGGMETCQGDAGGPTLRQTGTATELVALHSTSWQHGCLAVAENRQGGTEARTDNITDWIRQITYATDISLTGSRAMRLQNGSAYLKDGDGAWTLRWDGHDNPVAKVRADGTRIGVLLTNGDLWVKDDAAPDLGWLPEHDAITDFALSGQRLAVVNNGNVHLKDGNLQGGWTTPWDAQRGTATTVQVDDTRIGVLLTNNDLWVEDDAVPTLGWLPEADKTTAFDLAGDRIGIVSDGNVHLKDGNLQGGWTSPWDTQRGTATRIRVDDTRIGVLLTNNDLWVEDDAVPTLGWLPEADKTTAFDLAGDRIGIVQKGQCRVKIGNLQGVWTDLGQ